jgi:hypothetical protein
MEEMEKFYSFVLSRTQDDKVLPLIFTQGIIDVGIGNDSIITKTQTLTRIAFKFFAKAANMANMCDKW